MQLLHDASEETSSDRCAREVLACVPTVMQYIRSQSQSRRAKSLTVQQFRALGIVRHRGGMSLSELAEQLGLAVASTSRLVDGLVRRGFLERVPLPENRRQLRLSVRAAGEAILSDTLAATHRALAVRLARLTGEQRSLVSTSMRLLLESFDGGRSERDGSCPLLAAVTATTRGRRTVAKRKAR